MSDPYQQPYQQPYQPYQQQGHQQEPLMSGGTAPPPNPPQDHHTTSQPTTPHKQSFLSKVGHSSKAGFDKAWAGFEKLGVPVNKLTNKIGSEAFWPTGLGNESDKAARILKSFCKDGFLKDAPSHLQVHDVKGAQGVKDKDVVGPTNKPKVLVKIPQKVIQNCVGLAIFTVMRTGLWVSGAGGSGVLIARKDDGSWGPPSGILVHTLGVGFMAGIDIYDCVLVINNREALKAFSKLRVSLGGEISVVAGPLGVGGIVESEVMKDRKPVWTYVKSRGLYGGLQVDGTIIAERNDENAKFYGERLPIGDILAGKVRHIPNETRLLMEVLKQAEGKTNVDEHLLNTAASGPTPGDFEVEKMSEPTQEQLHAYAPPPAYHDGSAQGVPYFAPPPGSSYAGEKPPQQPPRPVSGNYSNTQTNNQSYAPPPAGPAPHLGNDGFPLPPPGPPPHAQNNEYYPPPPPVPHGTHEVGDNSAPPSYNPSSAGGSTATGDSKTEYRY